MFEKRLSTDPGLDPGLGVNVMADREFKNILSGIF